MHQSVRAWVCNPCVSLRVGVPAPWSGGLWGDLLRTVSFSSVHQSSPSRATQPITTLQWLPFVDVTVTKERPSEAHPSARGPGLRAPRRTESMPILALGNQSCRIKICPNQPKKGRHACRYACSMQVEGSGSQRSMCSACLGHGHPTLWGGGRGVPARRPRRTRCRRGRRCGGCRRPPPSWRRPSGRGTSTPSGTSRASTAPRTPGASCGGTTSATPCAQGPGGAWPSGDPSVVAVGCVWLRTFSVGCDGAVWRIVCEVGTGRLVRTRTLLLTEGPPSPGGGVQPST